MVGTTQDVTESRQAEEERTVQREQQARLAGMLFAASALVARMNENLAMSSGAIDRLRPDSGLAPRMREAIDAVATGLCPARSATSPSCSG